MSSLSNRIARRVCCPIALLFLLAATSPSEPLKTGDLSGTVADAQGRPLRGVKVTLDGASEDQITTARGEFRFPYMAPDTYRLTAEMEGFETSNYPMVVIKAGQTTVLTITLSAASEDP